MKRLPESFPQNWRPTWRAPLARGGLGGIAATQTHVFFGDRDVDDFHDVFRCLDASSGETKWEIHRLAIGALDYGNSPRATPLVWNDHVFFAGAHGHLLCVAIADGSVLWERHFGDDFPLDEELPWGYCGSPLLADGKLIVAPGNPNASVIACDPKTGNTLWETPGFGPSYGSLMVSELGGREQIVGHDAKTLGGWDLKTGERLWTVTPKRDGDFNVPTPVIHQGRLIVSTENNALRMFSFKEDGTIHQEPIAIYNRLRTDMSSPVVIGDRLYCAKNLLFCLQIKSDGFNELWRVRDRAIGDYASIIGSAERVLVIGKGQLLLLRSDGDQRVIDHYNLPDEPGVEIYSHPAVVGNRIYLRGKNGVVAYDF